MNAGSITFSLTDVIAILTFISLVCALIYKIKKPYDAFSTLRERTDDNTMRIDEMEKKLESMDKRHHEDYNVLIKSNLAILEALSTDGNKKEIDKAKEELKSYIFK